MRKFPSHLSIGVPNPLCEAREPVNIEGVGREMSTDRSKAGWTSVVKSATGQYACHPCRRVKDKRGEQVQPLDLGKKGIRSNSSGTSSILPPLRETAASWIPQVSPPQEHKFSSLLPHLHIPAGFLLKKPQSHPPIVLPSPLVCSGLCSTPLQKQLSEECRTPAPSQLLAIMTAASILKYSPLLASPTST